MKRIITTILAAAAVFTALQCTKENVVESDLQVSTMEFSGVSQTKAIGSAYITVNKVGDMAELGFCWSTSANPTVDDATITCENISDNVFTAQLQGLNPETLYYGRAFIKAAGKVYYGNVTSFTTKALPTGGWCIIDSVSDVSPNSANVVMQIADDGNQDILEYGVCYGLTIDPTVEDGKIVANPGGAGFKTSIKDLLQGTKYYVRPYFITESGVTYGESLLFTTLNFIKTVNVLPGYHAAYMFGQVLMDAGSPTTERGYVWAETENPTLENGDSFVAGNSGDLVGSYYNVLGGLKKGTTYYMRAYARNSDGVFYGTNFKFTTKEGSVLPGFVMEDMVKVEAGEFVMGDPDTDKNASPIDAKTYGKEPAHKVKISKDYYMSRYHVTNAQLCSFLNCYQSTRRRDHDQAIYNSSGRTFSFSNPTGAVPNLVFTPVKGCERKPGSNVTWGCVAQFYEWLSAELGVTCRFPTEAEYEYAARGGNKSQGFKYPGSNTLNEVCVMTDSKVGPSVVGSLKPNELGLYDMLGNAFCYVMDDYDIDFYFRQINEVAVDPVNPPKYNKPKVLRGTSFRHYSGNAALYLRMSSRGKCGNEADCGNHSGFRIVMEELPDPSLL